MAKLRILGFDPSYRNWGISTGLYDTETQQLTPFTLDLIQTEKTKQKQLRVNSDDIACSAQLWQGLAPYVEHAQVIFVEVPVGSQSAAAMKSYGICVGLLGCLRADGKIIMELTPKEIKMAATGNPEASKALMIQWGHKNFPHLPWPIQSKLGVKTVVASKAEHMADALAAMCAGIKSEQFRQFAAIKLL